MSETASEVLENLYPDRSRWTSIDIDNVEIEYDQAYYDEVKECAKRIKGINDKFSIRNFPSLAGWTPGPSSNSRRSS